MHVLYAKNTMSAMHMTYFIYLIYAMQLMKVKGTMCYVYHMAAEIMFPPEAWNRGYRRLWPTCTPVAGLDKGSLKTGDSDTCSLLAA